MSTACLFMAWKWWLGEGVGMGMGMGVGGGVNPVTAHSECKTRASQWLTTVNAHLISSAGRTHSRDSDARPAAIHWNADQAVARQGCNTVGEQHRSEGAVQCMKTGPGTLRLDLPLKPMYAGGVTVMLSASALAIVTAFMVGGSGTMGSMSPASAARQGGDQIQHYTATGDENEQASAATHTRVKLKCCQRQTCQW